jgi:hypothetical protein
MCLVRRSNLGQRGFAYGIRALVIALLIGKPEIPERKPFMCFNELTLKRFVFAMASKIACTWRVRAARV